MGRAFSNTQKQELWFRAGGRCEICRCRLGADWHADHVEPYAAGGPTELDNGQALCKSCNLRKSGGKAATGRRSELPKRDGDWWSTRRQRKELCLRCGDWTLDVVTVMAYRAEMDPHGEQRGMHPQWALRGWLQLIECERCGEQCYGPCLSDGDLVKIGRELGGWVPEDFDYREFFRR